MSREDKLVNTVNSKSTSLLWDMNRYLKYSKQSFKPFPLTDCVTETWLRTVIIVHTPSQIHSELVDLLSNC